ncbi:MAG: bis-aminopropyl spermidine synthase family protein [Caldilineaceae bacterium]|nr:bis-aminopropyl spermidine synthase family protein [Caldilineaceae bacterium]
MNQSPCIQPPVNLLDYAASFQLTDKTFNSLLYRPPQSFRDNLAVEITGFDRAVVEIVSQLRPPSLREFDQIPMRSPDLIRQVKLMAPYLASKSVVFLGDHDGTSLLLGLMSKGQACPSPKSMLLLDFDERLLVAANELAHEYGFSDILKTDLYNVFDPVPSKLFGQFDWFYTNPPYGCRNQGESARLFIARCCEFAHSQNSKGCIILPDDENRPWTNTAMDATSKFLHQHNWTIDEKLNQMHQYQLDDDQELASSVILVKRSSCSSSESPPVSYAGRRVDFDEIPHFYGLTVKPPYPRYIKGDGSKSYWSES